MHIINIIVLFLCQMLTVVLYVTRLFNMEFLCIVDLSAGYLVWKIKTIRSYISQVGIHIYMYADCPFRTWNIWQIEIYQKNHFISYNIKVYKDFVSKSVPEITDSRSIIIENSCLDNLIFTRSICLQQLYIESVQIIKYSVVLQHPHTKPSDTNR